MTTSSTAEPESRDGWITDCFLRVLPGNVSDEVTRRARPVRVAAGQYLYEPELSIVDEGTVRAFVTDTGGRQLTVSYMRHGAAIGLTHEFGRNYPAGFQAVTPTRLVQIDRSHFYQLADTFAPLVLADSVDPDPVVAGRWAGLAAGAARLGIAVVYLGDTPAADQVVTGTDRLVVGGERSWLKGVRLFGLRPDEAIELLHVVADTGQSHDESEDPDERMGAQQPADDASIDPLPLDASPEPNGAHGHPDGGEPDVIHEATAAPAAQPEPPDDKLGPAGSPWVEPSTTAATGEPGGARPITVDMLGPLRITVRGKTVTGGLRSRARALLVWFLLRPEGATAAEAVDALWPDTPPDRVHRQFWRPFGEMRARLRGPESGEALEVLVKTGDHYRAATSEISCDLWDFQAALGSAARTGDDALARAALGEAVGLYRGDLLAGADYLWVEPVRADLHRRAVDAHLRLAELEDRAGRPQAAVAVLERAIELDRYAEEPYRRLMTAHAEAGRTDRVESVWRLLNSRLAELDLDVDAATVRLHHHLTRPTLEAAPSRLPGGHG